MVDGFDKKATLFCYVDFVFLSFLAVLKMSFCYETPCSTYGLGEKKIAVDLEPYISVVIHNLG